MLQCSAQRSPSDPQYPGSTGDASPRPIGQGRKVLIIEDEETLGRNIKDYLEVDDFDACVCSDGESGLEMFETFRPDLVLLDLRLPGMDGLAVLERLRANDPQVTVIMMTAFGSTQAVAEARRAGVQTFLAKPLVLSQLRQAIDQAL